MSQRNLIGCCGIYCGACFAYRSEIPKLAKRLANALNQEKFWKIAVPFDWVGSYKDFRKWLGFLARIRCSGCQAGGGNPFCEIRRCCQKRGYVSCAECEEMPCQKLEWMIKRYKGWILKNLQRIKEVGYDAWLDEQRKAVEQGFKTGDVIASLPRPKKRRAGKQRRDY